MPFSMGFKPSQGKRVCTLVSSDHNFIKKNNLLKERHSFEQRS
jgi:hypothetical protein